MPAPWGSATSPDLTCENKEGRALNELVDRTSMRLGEQQRSVAEWLAACFGWLSSGAAAGVIWIFLADFLTRQPSSGFDPWRDNLLRLFGWIVFGVPAGVFSVLALLGGIVVVMRLEIRDRLLIISMALAGVSLGVFVMASALIWWL